MTTPQKASMHPRGAGSQPDAVERWLVAFFRSEMPPKFPVPVLPAARKLRFGWRSVFRSRMALAASVALLLSGSWYVAGQFRGVELPGTVAPAGPNIGKRDKKPATSNKAKELKNREAPPIRP